MTLKKVIFSTLAISSLILPTVVLAAANPTKFGPVAPFAGTSTGTIIDALQRIVNALLGFVAVIAVIFIIIGGVRYITSQGDEDAAASAKNTVLYALIGLIIIALSAVLVNFILLAI